MSCRSDNAPRGCSFPYAGLWCTACAVRDSEECGHLTRKEAVAAIIAYLRRDHGVHLERYYERLRVAEEIEAGLPFRVNPHGESDSPFRVNPHEEGDSPFREPPPAGGAERDGAGDQRDRPPPEARGFAE